MKKSYSILFAICFVFTQYHYAQVNGRKCASPKVDASYEAAFQDMLQKHQQFANNKKAVTVYNIPVIFHVIHSGQNVGTSINISQAQINSQVAILNQDFRKINADFSTWATQPSFINAAADCEINFCLAKVSPTGAELTEPGIERILCSSKGWTNPPHTDVYIDATIKPGSSWDPTRYLNIWVVYMNDGTLGYAQFPTIANPSDPVVGDMFGFGSAANTDGIVLDYLAIGNTGTANFPYDKGRTATHEIGHWLGLWHINGDSNCGNDYVTDTPAQSSLSSSCPSSSGAVVNSGCTSVSPNPPGRMYQNYMDYSPDRCLVLFTAGQKARMQAVMANCVRRNSLNISTVCNAVGIEEYVSIIDVNISPNPSTGELFVEVSLSDVQDYVIFVSNTLGQTVKEAKQLQSNGGKVKFDLSDNTAGVYFVSVKTKSGSKVKRIVLQ